MAINTDELALHPQTQLQLQRFMQHPPHALLLLGVEGLGKQHLVTLMVHEMLGLASGTDVMKYPYLRIVRPQEGKVSIGIEAIRDLQHFTSLKLPGSTHTLRFIVIPEAHLLTTEAQNALLKLLEEPPQDTTFLLTASNGQLLLPTIRSRTQQLSVHRPTRESLVTLFTKQVKEGEGAAKRIQQAYFMSGGLPGLMHALLNSEDHPLKTAALTARQILQSTQFERLCKVDELSKKKTEALQVLLILRHMSQAAIEQGAQAGGESGTKRIRQWHKVLQASFEAEKAYAVSAQSKLVLVNLMLAL